MLKYLGFMSLLIVKLASGQDGVDFAQKDPFVSDLYMKGEYLVYDCKDQHWVCTGRPEFDRCGNWRKQAMALKETNLRCAPFLKLESQSKCHELQIKMAERASKRFCLHPEALKKELRY